MDLSSHKVLYKMDRGHPFEKATGAAVANFIREHIITQFRILKRSINDNRTPFINKDMKGLTEAYYILPTRKRPGGGH